MAQDLKRIESSDLTLRPTMSSTSGRVNSTPDLWNEPTWRSTDAFEDPFVRNAGQAKADGDGLILVHEPDRPVADIVFVHGLGGSSHKSWSYGHDPRNFWPDWLKLEMGLSEARIHTFGYSAGIISQSKKVEHLRLFKQAVVPHEESDFSSRGQIRQCEFYTITLLPYFPIQTADPSIHHPVSHYLRHPLHGRTGH